MLESGEARMRSILLLNPKGGSGKTTLATNLAVYFALKGKSVALVDFDPQGSSIDWLAERPADRPTIKGVAAREGGVRIPSKMDYVIMDAPAGLHGEMVSSLVRRAQTLLVPVVPSPIDLRAAIRFHDELMRMSALHKRRVAIATVANRVRENSTNRDLLEDFLRSLKLPDGRKLPFVACIRSSQNYLRAAERGLGIFEGAPSLVGHDTELWRPLFKWLNSKRSVPP
jgi:chromosome partitioning protein